MPFFQMNPLVIEARLLTLETLGDVQTWCGGRTWSRPPMRMVTGLEIPTGEGWTAVPYGDWVVKGVTGAFSSCKPDVFALTYAQEPDGE